MNPTIPQNLKMKLFLGRLISFLYSKRDRPFPLVVRVVPIMVEASWILSFELSPSMSASTTLYYLTSMSGCPSALMPRKPMKEAMPEKKRPVIPKPKPKRLNYHVIQIARDAASP